ncbi:MAG: baseplate J/gp47 family protein, partial [Cytophagales bacterium]|nr:baseplate J/gp47 family protein [Cytophagales bacterium]
EQSFQDCIQTLEELIEAELEYDKSITYVLANSFRFSFSHAEGEHAASCRQCELFEDRNELVFILDIPESAPSVGICEVPASKGTPSVALPFLKARLSQSSKFFLFSLFSSLKVVSVGLQASADNQRQISIISPFAPVKAEEPFQPFGFAPENNSAMLLDLPEWSSKEVNRVALAIKWQPLKTKKSMADYFSAYPEKVCDEDYRLVVSIRKSSDWEPVYDEPLFVYYENDSRPWPREVCAVDLPFPVSSSIRRPGALKVELRMPEIGLGHSYFAQTLSQVLLHNSRVKRKKHHKEYPNPPFTLTIEEISLSYSSESDFVFGKADRFFHIHDYGYKETSFESYEAPPLLLPVKYPHNFLMALDKVPKNRVFSFYVDLGTSREGLQLQSPADFDWYYLQNNEWLPLGKENVLNDLTNDFSMSGAVRLRLPSSFVPNNTLYPNDYFWLKASSYEASPKYFHRLKRIEENIIYLSWKDIGYSSHLKVPLPVKTELKSVEALPEVKSIQMLKESFGGRNRESKEHFLIRASERLRHKSRAILVRDYEELLLEEFPKTGRVKCFTAQKGSRFLKPGEVYVVPVDRKVGKGKLYYSQEELYVMQQFLERFVSPFVKITVINPVYEYFQISARVQFSASDNVNYLLNKLRKEVAAYFRRWMSEDYKKVVFSRKIYLSEIISLIQNLDYVEFVTGLSMAKIYGEENEKKLDDTARDDRKLRLSAAYPWSILMYKETFDILANEDHLFKKPIPKGIGNLRMNQDFIID